MSDNFSNINGKQPSLFLNVNFKPIIGFCFFIFILSCDSSSNETDNFDNLKDEEVILEANSSTWVTYKGIVPCADCEGIEMELKLENQLDEEEKEFELTEIYLGTSQGNRNFVTRGTYHINYGIDNDPVAILITLMDEKSEEMKTFVQEEDQGLTLLGKDGKRIDSKLNYRLKKE